MGSTEVKHKLRSHIARLIELKGSAFEDPSIWSLFWTLPTSIDDVMAAFIPSNIRHIRDTNIKAFSKLIQEITYRFIYLSKVKHIAMNEFPTVQLLNCVRMLTVLLPFLYERPNLSYIEESIYWTQIYRSSIYADDEFINESDIPIAGAKQSLLDMDDLTLRESTEANFVRLMHFDKLVGVELIEACLNLLFTLNFTVETHDNPKYKSSTFANDYQPIIWEVGVESSGHYRNPKLALDSNRLEILRFLTSLFSNNMYNRVDDVSNCGSKFLTVLVTATDGKKFFTLCVSLLNTILRSLKVNDKGNKSDDIINIDSDNHNGLEISDTPHKRIRILMTTNVIQLLTLLIVYSIPKKDVKFLRKHNLTGNQPVRNKTRVFLNIIQETQALKLVIISLVAPLFKPVNDVDFGAFSSIIKSSNIMDEEEVHFWATEIVMIILEFYQCNAKFRAVFAEIVGANYLIVLIYYVIKCKTNKHHASFVQLCAFNMLFFSADLRLALKLLSTVDMNFYDALPQIGRISTTPTSYRDYMIIQLCNYVDKEGLEDLTRPLVEVLHNMIGLHVMILEFNQKENKEVLTNRRISIKDISKSHPTQISYVASTSIFTLIMKCTAVSYLENNSEKAADTSSLLLRACAQAIVRDPFGSIILLYVFSKNTNWGEKINANIKKISNDKFAELLQAETKEYYKTVEQVQQQQQNDIKENTLTNEGLSRVDHEFSKRNTLASKDSIEMPQLSRQTTQNTLESIPSIRSMPTISRQASQLSISVGAGSNQLFAQDDSIDPMFPVNQKNCNELQLQQDDNNFDAKTILYSEDVFKSDLPIGMSEKKKAKQPYYMKFYEKWAGNQALLVLQEYIKIINNEKVNQPNGNQKVFIPDASYAIQKLLRLDLNELFDTYEKPVNFDSNKTEYDPIKIKWNSVSLGWYVSLVWADIYINYDVQSSKSLLAEISSGFSAIKKASTSWGFGGWKLNSTSDNLSAPSLSNECGNFNDTKPYPNNIYYDNILKRSIWFGTHITLFRVNPQVLKEHYTLQRGKVDLGFNNISFGNGTPTSIFSEVFERKSSISSPSLNKRNGSGVLIEGFWKRQGGRPASLERRDSDSSLKSQLSKGINNK